MFRSLTQPDNHQIRYAPIGNSATVAIGDSIVPGATGHTTAVVNAASNSTNPILGVVVGIIGAQSKVLEVTSTTVGSSNETTNTVQVAYIPANLPFDYEADLTAAAGTTSADNKGYCWFNMSSTAGKLDETSYALFSGTEGQFWSYGVTTYSTTKVSGHWAKFL